MANENKAIDRRIRPEHKTIEDTDDKSHLEISETDGRLAKRFETKIDGKSRPASKLRIRI